MADSLIFAKADRLIFFVALVFNIAGWNRLYFGALAFGIAASAFATAVTVANRRPSCNGASRPGYLRILLWRVVSIAFFVVATWRIGTIQGYF
jgi:hypothetical protein